MTEGDAAEWRPGIETPDYEIAFAINLDVVLLRCVFEEQGYIKCVDRFGALAVFVVEFVDDFFGDHWVGAMQDS